MDNRDPRAHGRIPGPDGVLTAREGRREQVRLSVATNFRPDLIEAIKGYPVWELFGKLPADALGGGRASYMLSAVSKRALAVHVREARRHGIRFNYLLNAACLDNREWTRKGQRQIRRLLDWLAELEIDAVTVSLPYLLELIKRCYPQLRVTVGVFAGVDHVQKGKALRLWAVNPLRLMKVRRLAESQGMLSPLRRDPPVIVDNRTLDGFLKFFVHVDCRERDCEECRYCHRVAELAVWVDPEFRRDVLRRYDEVLENLRSGAMWRFGGISGKGDQVHEIKES